MDADNELTQGVHKLDAALLTRIYSTFSVSELRHYIYKLDTVLPPCDFNTPFKRPFHPWAVYYVPAKNRSTPASEFLKTAQLDPSAVAFVRAQMDASVAVWHVDDVQTNTIHISHLLTGEARKVTEHSASKALQADTCILARVVALASTCMFCGAHPVAIPKIQLAHLAPDFLRVNKSMPNHLQVLTRLLTAWNHTANPK